LSLLLIGLTSPAVTGPAETSPSEPKGDTDTDTYVYDDTELPPPERPPEPALLLEDGTSQASGTRQLGVPVYHLWAVHGKLETYESKPPLSWPKPLRVKSTDEAIVDLGTDVLPYTVEVRVYEDEEVGPQGVPDPETEI
jgi:hypothetical protein